MESNFQIKVYPNPARNYVTFDVSDHHTMEHERIELYHINGRLITEIPITENRLIYEWNVENLSPGMYFYRIGTITGKLVIE